MKKSLLAILLIISLIHLDYRRAESLTIPVGVGVGSLIVVTAAGVAYYSRSGAASSVNAQAVSRASNAYWYSKGGASAALAVLITAHKPLVSTLPTSTVMAAASADPSKYPLLASHTKQSTALNTADPVSDYSSLSVGSYVLFAGNNYILNTKTSTLTCMSDVGSRHDTNYPYFNGTTYGDRYYQRNATRGSCTAPNWSYTLYIMTGSAVSSGVVPVVPATPSQFALKIAPTGTITSSALEDELDRMRAIPEYVPTFNDESTGLPWAPPAGEVIKPDKADVLQNLIAARDAAKNAVEQAQLNVGNAGTALTADPSNPERVRDLDNARLQLARAQAELARLQAELAKELPVTDTPDPDDDMPDIGDTPSLKSIDWSSGRRLLGQMETAWPFNLLLSLRGLLQPLESSPVAPSFDLPIYGTSKLSISLAVFDPLAAILRWAFSLLLTYSGILLVVRWYRGGGN